MTADKRLKIALAVMILLFATLLVYLPGQSGSLLLDDAWVLQPLAEGDGINSSAEARQFIFGNTAGPSGRPVAMFSLFLNARDWPPDVAALKLTNIAFHLACGLALFAVARLLGGQLGLGREQSSWFALVVAGLWLLHPLNVSTTLYVVQRMAQLMTLFTLLSLWCFLKGRLLLSANPEQVRRGLAWLLASLFPFGLLAVLSKENGALLLALILIIEVLVFRFAKMTRSYRAWLLLGVSLPLLLVLVYLIWSMPDSLAAYATRPFDLGERLLTESRVLSHYIAQLLLPWVGVGYLFHDDLTISTGLFAPATTLVAMLFCLLLLVSAWLLRQRQTVYALAVFWFFAMHFLESTYLPLELVFEHRNYLAMIGPTLALVWYGQLWLTQFLSRYDNLAGQKKAISFASGLIVLSLFAWQTWNLSSLWGEPVSLHAHWAEEQPQSIRAQSAYARILEANGHADLAAARLEQARSFRPNELTLLLNQWLLACRSDLSAPVSLADIAANDELVHYQSDLNIYLRQLLEAFFQGQCEFPDIETLIALFDRIGQLPLNDFVRAGYHVYFSDIYVYQQRLDPALMQMSRAFELRPVAQYPVRQALICASAGRFNDALIFLERARAADDRRNPLVPSIAAEIDRLEREFRARI